MQGKKFDMRFYLIVHSLEPLRLVRHNLFVLRIANVNFSYDNFYDYQKHFTLMSSLAPETSSAEDSLVAHKQSADCCNVDPYSLESVRGSGSRSDPHMNEFIELFDKEQEELAERKNKDNGFTDGSAPTEGPIIWVRDIQPKIDSALRSVFETVRDVYRLQPPHPSGTELHPNAGSHMT